MDSCGRIRPPAAGRQTRPRAARISSPKRAIRPLPVWWILSRRLPVNAKPVCPALGTAGSGASRPSRRRGSVTTPAGAAVRLSLPLCPRPAYPAAADSAIRVTGSFNTCSGICSFRDRGHAGADSRERRGRMGRVGIPLVRHSAELHVTRRSAHRRRACSLILCVVAVCNVL